MFTGIIEEVGRIRAIERQAVSARLTVAASKVLSDVHLGDSIAVNGVCLTVTSFGRDYFCADVMHETLNRSSLGALGVKSPVNLENDCIGKYVAKLIGAEEEDKAGKGMTREFLQRYGF